MPSYIPSGLLDDLGTVIGQRIKANAGGGGASLNVQNFTNRFYLYTDQRWISAVDGNYGFDDINSSESAGKGATPLVEWENQGLPFDVGDTIKQVQFRLRTNNIDVGDLELYLAFIHPDAETRWVTGFDNDGEMTTVVLHNDLFKVPLVGAPITAAMNDRSRRVVDLNYTVPVTGELRVFMRSTLPPTATRYAYCTTTIKHEPA